MENASLDFAKSLFKGYYASHPIAVDKVASREFGFGDFERKIKYRHYAFGSNTDLNKFIVENAPPFISCSSSFYEYPAARPMEKKVWKGSELVFDLDATDLKLPCQTVHGTGWVCSECLSGIKAEAIKLIEDFLVPDFGFEEKRLHINFSGNRGYHVRIADERIISLNSAERKQISDYITGNGINAMSFFPSISERATQLRGPKPTDGGWGGRIARGTINALNKGAAELALLGIEKKEARLLEKHRADIILGISVGNWDKVKISKKSQLWANLIKGMTVRQGDSIDKNVTDDTHHLLRVPDTLHGDTGLVSKTINSLKGLSEFEPMRDAIAMGEESIKVHVESSYKFTMNGQEFGPYKNEDVKLPGYAGIYLILKRAAYLVQ